MKTDQTHDIYLTATPYHILLAIGHSSDNKKSDNKKILVLRPDFLNYKLMIKSLELWDKCPFYKIILLNGNFSQNSFKIKHKRLSYILSSIDNIPKIKKLVDSLKDCGKNIFIFNDTIPEFQYICYENKINNNTYIEDGSAAYSSNKTIKNSQKLKTIVSKFLFGNWYTPTYHNLGTSKYISNCKVFYPDLANSNLKNRNIGELSKTILNQIDKNYLDIVKKLYDLPELPGNTLIILEHSEFISANIEYIKLIKELISKKIKNNEKILVKYHPRETDHYMGEIINNNVSYINQSIPMELIYLTLDTPNIEIYGGASTALLTAKILRPNSKVFSFANTLNLKDEQLKNTFKAIEITLI
ncbi:hypothetical protein MMKA1_03810 [Methanococcus maripaludis KA1]|uniref:Uncharacterized protein n=1 Tax=Methanococcus maripaludis KA1 TaxID=637914 RepID=A0A2Z5PG41_METMI|nr:polysialyltransferase family glycosyltransferase [Methanococcus maripaludis]BAP60498.1 hypothetical protein MMKA1_03810 [Methanococcus maripaludis KA1]